MKKASPVLAVMFWACILHAAPQTRTILVFPFENQSVSADLGWISEAFSQVLSVRLQGPGRFLLGSEELNGAYQQYGIPPYATLTLASEYKVAQTLGVGWAVIGSFDVENQQITARAQLLDLPRLKLYPALQASGPLTDLVGVQTRLAWKLLETSGQGFQGETEQAFAQQFPPIRLDALENYTRGILAPPGNTKVEFLTAAARLDPAAHRAAFALGKYYFDQKDYSNSVFWLSKMNSHDEDYLNSLFLRGVDDFLLGQNQQAEDAFKTLAGQMPLDEVWNDLGVLEIRRGDYAGALASFQRSYQGDPADEVYSFNLGACYCDLKQYRQAVIYLQKSVASGPGDLGAHTLLAYALSRLGDSAGSQAQIEWVAEHDGRTMADLNTSILPQPRLKKTYNGEAFRLLSVAVENSLESQLSKQPPGEQGRVHLLRGEEFIKQARFPEAIQELTEAVQAMPSNSAARLFLGQAYELHGDHQKAIVEFQASVSLYDSAVAHLWLAHAYVSLRQFPEAQAEARAALELNPGDPDAERLLDSIRQEMPSARKDP